MPLIAILFLLISAALHATWNLQLKQVQDKYMATWWVVTAGAVISVLGLAVAGLPPRAVWGFVLVSVLAEALYFWMLSHAYQQHDFSLIYPVARGAAPALLAVWSFLFLGERLTGGGLVGLVLIILGLLIIGAPSLLESGAGRVHLAGIASALLVALLISIYTAIDGTAVKRTPALPYALTVFALIPLPLMPFMLRKYGWSRLLGVWSQQRLRLTAISLLGIVAYFFALAAYSIAPLSYSGAIREVSVVLGTFAGWRLLGERLGPMRLGGAAVIFVGLLVIAMLA